MNVYRRQNGIAVAMQAFIAPLSLVEDETYLWPIPVVDCAERIIMVPSAVAKFRVETLRFLVDKGTISHYTHA